MIGMLALLLTAQGNASTDLRIAVVAGSNIGDANEQPLGYAESDARRFYELMLEVGGIDRDRSYLVLGGGANRLRRVLAEASGRLLELGERGPTTFIVYVSAHADEEALHLEGERFPIEELRNILARSRARLRLAIIDACRTPVAAQRKGGSAAPEVALAIDRRTQIEGDVQITSAGRGEAAQEWTYLRGSLFTHHLLAGLRGLADADRSGAITLAEAYGYAFHQTSVQAALSSAGPQHPSFEIDTSGWGEWTFSRPDRLGAALVLARDLEGALWIADRKNELVAELAKAPGAEVRVAVKPGWYRVVRPLGRIVEVADVNLSTGGERTVGSEMMVRMPAEPARLRGGDPIVLRPWRGTIAGGVGSGLVDGAIVQPLLHGRVSRAIDDWSLQLALSGSYARFAGDRIRISQYELGGDFFFGRIFWLDLLELTVSLGGGVSWVRQSIARDDTDRERLSRLVGFEGDAPKSAWVPQVALRTELAFPLDERFWLGVEGTFGVAFVEELDTGLRPRPRGSGGLSASVAF